MNSRRSSHAGLFRLSLSMALLLSAAAILVLFASNMRLTTAESWMSMLGSSAFWTSLRLSLISTAITTCIAILLGIPAAYLLSRKKGRLTAVMDVVVSLPVVLPASTIGLMLLVTFQSAPLMHLQQLFGSRMAYSQTGIVLAQLIIALAIGIRAFKAAFDGVDPRYEHVGRSLGASRPRVFFWITLPAAKGGLLSGAILAWSRALAEFGAVLIFCSAIRGKTDILPVAMFLDVNAGELERAVGIGFSLAILSVVSLGLLRLAQNLNRKEQTP